MRFYDLPLHELFYFNGNLYTKICPRYKSCCVVEYNAINQSGYILIDNEADITPADPEIQYIKTIKFYKGEKMRLRQVPVDTKFKVGDAVFTMVGNDKVKDENDEVIKMNKNTHVVLVDDVEEKKVGKTKPKKEVEQVDEVAVDDSNDIVDESDE